MLDCFEIVTTSGVVLWSRSNASVGLNVVNSLINDVFIEEKVRPAVYEAANGSVPSKPTYRYEKYTLKWTLVKDLGLIFVVSWALVYTHKSVLSLKRDASRRFISLFCILAGSTSYWTTSERFLSMCTTIS